MQAHPWLLPQSDDLLRDVAHLQACFAREQDADTRDVFAHATVVMGMAAIEAVTNDALAAVLAVMTAKPPGDRGKEAPWIHFAGRSARRVAMLLHNGKFVSRRTYVLWQIERVTGQAADESLLRGIDRLRQVRNGIVHANSRPRSATTEDTLAAAATTGDCALAYLDFLGSGFAILGLPFGKNPL